MASTNRHKATARARKAYQIAHDFSRQCVRAGVVPHINCATEIAELADNASGDLWRDVAEIHGRRPPSDATIAAAIAYLHAAAETCALLDTLQAAS